MAGLRRLAAHVERQTHVFFRGQRGEKVVRLKYEADMPAAQVGQLFGIEAIRNMPGNCNAARRWGENAAENREQRRLA